MKKSYIIPSILMLSMSIAVAQEQHAQDVQTRASDSQHAPPTPPNFTLVGHWDVDGGGAWGTDGSTGSFMMGMYVRYSSSETTYCVSNVELRASDSSFPPPGPAGSRLVGFWDVDKGGGQGTDGSRGSYMMALYINVVPTCQAAPNNRYVKDIQLRASDSSVPPPGPGKDYSLVGFWDVDGGGGQGTDGSTGSYMMAMYAKYSQ